MMLNFCKLEPADIQHVVKNSWERGRAEAQLFGLKNPEDIIAHLLSISNEYGYTLKVDDEPVAVFGASAHERSYYTWFVATERFNEVGAQATRFLHGFIKERIAGRPDATLELISAVDHPEADKWFKFLGFSLVRKEGAFTRYEYKRLTKEARRANIKQAEEALAMSDNDRKSGRHVLQPKYPEG